MCAADMKRAVDGGVDEIAHMSIDRVPSGLIKRMVARKIDWIPTFELCAAIEICSIGPPGFDLFLHLGGIVALGTDYGGYSTPFDLGTPMHELTYMKRDGMTPMQIIVAATKNAAWAIGLGKTLGTLEAGKIADVIVINGNPLRRLGAFRRITYVVHNGVVERAPA
jgi:imidazolonepropionase-like amidohydrolase